MTSNHPGSSSRAVAPTASSSTSSLQQTSLRGQKVLQEESYVSSLSSLIQREFFPNLPRLTAENDYLTALEEFDNGVEGAEGRMRDAEWRLDALDEQDKRGGSGHRRKRRRVVGARGDSRANTPLETPLHPGRSSRWDPTPGPTPRHGQWPTTPSALGTPSRYGDDDGMEVDPLVGDSTAVPDLSQHTLASFQRAYTSEDNASFLSLLQATNDQRKERYRWAFNQEQRHNERRKLILDEAAKRADEGYARSVMALPEPQRRKLIASDKLEGGIGDRVKELEKLYVWEEERRKRHQKMITGGQVPTPRMIRAGSEESTSATDSAQPSSTRHASLFANRARSASPPPPSGLRPLKHSLDPNSEIRLENKQQSEKKDDLRDDILRPPPVLPSAATAAGTRWSVRNALFYGPDANIGTTDKSTSSLPEQHSTEDASTSHFFHRPHSNLKSKTNFHNTALPSQGLFPESRYPEPYSSSNRSRASSSAGSVSSSRIASALAGGSRYGDHFNDEDGKDMRYKGPNVNGYEFVTPVRDSEEEELRKLQFLRVSPPTSSKDRLRSIATHSQSTSGGATSSRPGFAIPATPKREELAHSLASSSKGKATHPSTPSLRQSLGLRSTRTPSSKRSEFLSPAAKTLLGRSVRGSSLTPARGAVNASTAARRSAQNDDTMAKLKRRGWDEG